MQSIEPIRTVIEDAASPAEAYAKLVSLGRLQADSGQAEAIELLDAFFLQLRRENEKKGILDWLGIGGGASGRCGIYLWGDVGRGKSMAMDLLYDKIDFIPKKRVHFHAFMQDIHARIHSWRQLRPKADLLSKVVSEIAADIRLLCLDELQVHDITDAAIVSRLFEKLFDAGVRVVFTSNRPPMALYQGGIGRDQFVPFIELVEYKMDVLKLKSDTDYRLEQLRALRQSYIYPLCPQADEFLYSSYQKLTQCQPSETVVLRVSGRQLTFDKTACGVLWVTFAELCQRALGAADYLEIASIFHTVILQNIPQLRCEDRNEARRFVMLIDALYEHRVKLICSAEAPPLHLYPAGDGSFEFERTASRLLEMQSERYLSLDHIGG